MKIDTGIDRTQGLRTHRVTGVIDVNALAEALKVFYGSPAYDPAMNVLWDLREADVSAVTVPQIRSFMKFVSAHWGKEGTSRAALIVSQDLDYGLSRMYELQMDGAVPGRIRVCRNLHEVREWLQMT